MEERESTWHDERVRMVPEEDGVYRFLLYGELDHHSVKPIRETVDQMLIDHRPLRVILDLNGVTFTDSAGLGLILGRYTRISGYGGTVQLVGVSEEFMKILVLAGADRFIAIEKRNGRAKRTNKTP